MSKVLNPLEHHHHHHDDDELEVKDPAQESLADALRVSFGLLKLLMIGVVLFYLVLGSWFNVDQQHVAVLLQFGRIVGEIPEGQVLRPGPHLRLPYPFQQDVQIPTTSRTIQIDRAFWWQVPDDAPDLVKLDPLNPLYDGWLMTADANIIHARWSLTYQILRRGGLVDAEAVMDFFKNVGNAVRAEQLVRAVAEQTIVQTAAITRSDDLMRSRIRDPNDRDTDELVLDGKHEAIRQMQISLDRMGSGLEVTDLLITRPVMPLPVRSVYEAVTEAVTRKAQRTDEAHKKRIEILGAVAGDAHEPLWQLIQAYEQAHMGHRPEDTKLAGELMQTLGRLLRREVIRPDDLPGLVDLPGPVTIGGQVASVVRQAMTYKTEVVNSTRRQAVEIRNLQPEFNKNRLVFMTDRLSTTLEQILTSPDVETHYMAPGLQLYIESNMDPQLKRQDEQQRLAAEASERARNR